ncbi:hypothetical protein, partial [Psychroserpens sp.]|uniref:hypothetical protein n=1 Tax=Psychroserpens sp. TaxID=2020870 RepID=UPI003C73494C
KTKKHPNLLIQKKGKLLIGKHSTTLSVLQLHSDLTRNNTTPYSHKNGILLLKKSPNFLEL